MMKKSAERKLKELYEAAVACENVTTGAPHIVAEEIRWTLDPLIEREDFLVERYEMRMLIQRILSALNVTWDIKEDAPIWDEADELARDV